MRRVAIISSGVRSLHPLPELDPAGRGFRVEGAFERRQQVVAAALQAVGFGIRRLAQCSAPLRFGQPFVIFRLRVCMARMGIGGGVGLGFGS
jgi:hypothetical protein